jgi:hypothetical protein
MLSKTIPDSGELMGAGVGSKNHFPSLKRGRSITYAEPSVGRVMRRRLHIGCRLRLPRCDDRVRALRRSILNFVALR